MLESLERVASLITVRFSKSRAKDDEEEKKKLKMKRVNNPVQGLQHVKSRVLIHTKHKEKKKKKIKDAYQNSPENILIADRENSTRKLRKMAPFFLERICNGKGPAGPKSRLREKSPSPLPGFCLAEKFRLTKRKTKEGKKKQSISSPLCFSLDWIFFLFLFVNFCFFCFFIPDGPVHQV